MFRLKRIGSVSCDNQVLTQRVTNMSVSRRTYRVLTKTLPVKRILASRVNTSRAHSTSFIFNNDAITHHAYASVITWLLRMKL
jgi:hypothetical protein